MEIMFAASRFNRISVAFPGERNSGIDRGDLAIFDALAEGSIDWDLPRPAMPSRGETAPLRQIQEWLAGAGGGTCAGQAAVSVSSIKRHASSRSR
jgi:hypothetical protein